MAKKEPEPTLPEAPSAKRQEQVRGRWSFGVLALALAAILLPVVVLLVHVMRRVPGASAPRAPSSVRASIGSSFARTPSRAALPARSVSSGMIMPNSADPSSPLQGDR